MPKALVIGGGAAGLTAARALQATGWTVLVVDKGRGAGGRLATRRVEAVDGVPLDPPAVFDYGAQYFTARDPRFLAMTREWQSAGVVRVWADGFGATAGAAEARYAAVGGMRAVAKHLAQGLEVRTGVRVTSLKREPTGWSAAIEGGETLSADAIVLTPPAPQSLELLAAGDAPLTPDERSVLEGIAYDPCWAGLAVLAGASGLPEPGGLHVGDGPIRWLADNTMKGVSRAAGSAVTIHAAPDFTRRHWDDPPAVVAGLLSEAARPLLAAAIRHLEVHRWKFSLATAWRPEPCLALACGGLVLAGDGFGGPRVEAAVLSGLAAADWLSNGADPSR
ncbi:MAG: NAD(P)/FAD-dependent oxidoreductase [Planctomycetia bacterium]